MAVSECPRAPATHASFFFSLTILFKQESCRGGERRAKSNQLGLNPNGEFHFYFYIKKIRSSFWEATRNVMSLYFPKSRKSHRFINYLSTKDLPTLRTSSPPLVPPHRPSLSHSPPPHLFTQGDVCSAKIISSQKNIA